MSLSSSSSRSARTRTPNATFAVLFEDGDASNLDDHAAVDDKFLLGTEALAGFTAASDDNKVKKIGYCGPKKILPRDYHAERQ